MDTALAKVWAKWKKMNQKIGQKNNFVKFSSAKWLTLYKFVNDDLHS